MGLGVKVKIIGTENRVDGGDTGSGTADDATSGGNSSGGEVRKSAQLTLANTIRSLSNKIKSTGAYTVYVIEMSTRSSGRPWTVQHRFSEFLALHERLRTAFDQAELPTPPKKNMRQRQFDAVAIDERKTTLTQYLVELLASSVAEQSVDVRNFLALNAEGTGPAPDHQEQSAAALVRPMSPSIMSDDDEGEDVACERPVMIKDSEVDQCETCLIQFSLLERKHHCRRCGNIFCKRCASKSIELPTLGHASPVRVCDGCFKTETLEREADAPLLTSVKDSKNMRSCVEAVFCGLGPEHFVFISPHIPLDKFKNAARSCKIPTDERPVVLLDNSKMRSGYSAVVFGVRGVYFYCATLPETVGAGYFAYPQLFKQHMYTEDDDNLHVGPHKIINLSHVRLTAAELLELLESLKQYVQTKELAAKQMAAGGVLSSTGGSGGSSAPPSSEPTSSASQHSFVEPVTLSKDQLPGSDDEWLTLLSDAFKGLGPQNACFRSPDIPGQKLQNFRKKGKLALDPDERALLFIDNTKQGSGYQGILFTATGVRFCADRLRAGQAGTGFLSWYELFASRLAIQGKSVLHQSSGKLLNLAGSAIVPAQLIECMHSLVQSLSHRPTSGGGGGGDPLGASSLGGNSVEVASDRLATVNLDDESTYLEPAAVAGESTRKLVDVQPLEFDSEDDESGGEIETEL